MPAGSGPRYTDWSHLHTRDGDRDAAAPYISEARKLLGFVMDEAKRSGLGSHKAKRTLQDGTVIVAEKIGDIPRMTILPKGKGEPIEIRTLEGFFFQRRTADTPEATAALLTPPTEESDWKALFYSSEADGYALAPEDRRGTYIDVFGTKTKKPWYRLESGGGIWVDRDTGEAVTWFRGYLGYWPMHYRHPATNYGQVVSIYGHLVYAVPFEDWRVLAAAKRGMWLYVLIAENLGHLTPPERPSVATESGQMWFSQPYTDTEYTYSLWRYPLVVVTEPDTRIDTYRAAAHESAELLWQGGLELAYGAWSFNADCTSVVTLQLPRRAIIKLHAYLDGALNLWRYSTDVWPDYPVVEAKRIELAISHGVGTPSVTLNQTLAPETIAEEDGVVLDLVLAERTTPPGMPGITDYSRLEYRCGEFSVTAYEAYRQAEPGPPAHLSRDLVYAHLPTMTFLFLRKQFGGGNPETVDIRHELYIGGVETSLEDPYAVSAPVSSASPYSDDIRQRLDTPFFGVTNTVGNFALKVDIDSMTLLLGMRFTIRDVWGAGGADGPNSQSYLFVSKPYVPMTIRLNAPPPLDTFSGAIPAHAGAGGWSFSKYGGPGPTFAWDDGNPRAVGTGFNRGTYADDAPILGPIPCAFGYAAAYDGTFLAATKLDVWSVVSTVEGETSPYPFSASFYPLSSAHVGGARELVEAVAPNQQDDETMYFASYPIGHTGEPMPRQQTRFAA